MTKLDFAQIINHVCEANIIAINQIKSIIDPFILEKVAKAILAVEGKIIFSGIGKSGHVAKRAAASCASMGSPAFYLHPAEASHGDLGMISSNDLLIAVSYSGNSFELKSVLEYAKNINCPIIGVASCEDSIVGSKSDLVIKIPKITDITNFPAPFVSTNTISILLDIIIFAVFENKSFSREEYKRLHPGGNIGILMLKVKDLMHRGQELPIVRYNQQMDQVLLEITSKRFGCAGVVNQNDEFLGMITDGDIRRHMAGNLLQLTAQEVMTPLPKTVLQEDEIAEVLVKFTQYKITNAFVVKEKKIIGLIHIHDILQKTN
ncbi:KpsF/GutQ family sugar-phosphate isomerase [Rickettsiales endosymbiont of Stachyamoeba lipophora]|uniref:KpsF/GutQ family sugar-phosphate isomerase n=1 Tax=Rickettsiales endosymbiont of Stachyamoeba lipophora TaxID=2486578 RepID=UPI000F64A52B|nr:KpsF/GutQ family sugar-phosphate isomerase [Rickettsiales endosymbiont of Stachyamoeba lipophora]AZL15000.1 KpsF/GutQ family sugar-phosphate isomerase [Rickettsiales endosymbiont of Stachyamoeba lipophora]